MINLSSARKIGTIARAAAKHAGRTRTGSALLSGIRTASSHLGRVLRQLWLEVTGFVFLALSAVGGFAVAKEWSKYEAMRISPNRIVLAVCFTLLFGWFGFSSFWRVRRKADGKKM